MCVCDVLCVRGTRRAKRLRHWLRGVVRLGAHVNWWVGGCNGAATVRAGCFYFGLVCFGHHARALPACLRGRRRGRGSRQARRGHSGSCGLLACAGYCLLASLPVWSQESLGRPQEVAPLSRLTKSILPERSEVRTIKPVHIQNRHSLVYCVHSPPSCLPCRESGQRPRHLAPG